MILLRCCSWRAKWFCWPVDQFPAFIYFWRSQLDYDLVLRNYGLNLAFQLRKVGIITAQSSEYYPDSIYIENWFELLFEVGMAWGIGNLAQNTHKTVLEGSKTHTGYCARQLWSEVDFLVEDPVKETFLCLNFFLIFPEWTYAELMSCYYGWKSAELLKSIYDQT